MADSHPERASRCLVLGAGAQGLACALRLWENGWDVTIVARDWCQGTTSTGAGAIWEYPPFQVQPQQDARRWVLASLNALLGAMRCPGGSDACGVRLRPSYYVFRNKPQETDFQALAELAHPMLEAKEGLPPDGLVQANVYNYGFSYNAPIISMSRYLPWLVDAIGRLPGVRLLQDSISDYGDILRLKKAEGAEIVINCLGLGARHVFGDEALHGVRGDLIYTLAPGLEDRLPFAQISDEDHPGGLTYLVPQVGGIIGLAGCAEETPDAEAKLEPREDIRTGILERCLEAFPCLGKKPVIAGQWAGLRPQRKGGIRLELEEHEKLGPVIHNYGHGGSGVVTSWGCASDVAALARSRLEPTKTLARREAVPQLAGLVNLPKGSRL